MVNYFFFFFPCLRMLFKYIHFFTPEHSFIIILKCSYGLISIMRKNTCHSIIISHLKSNDLGCVPKCSSTIYCLKSAAKLWNVLTLDHLLMLQLLLCRKRHQGKSLRFVTQNTGNQSQHQDIQTAMPNFFAKIIKKKKQFFSFSRPAVDSFQSNLFMSVSKEITV